MHTHGDYYTERQHLETHSRLRTCTTGPICSPKAGESWFQDQISPVIWNADSTAPFDKYEKVDMYIFDDTTQAGTKLLSDVDLSLGMAAVTLESGLFPDSLPVNRSCHILLTRVDNALDGTHQTLNSSTFFLIRTKQNVSGTLVPLPSATSTTASLTSSSSPAPSSSSTSSTKKTTSTLPNIPGSNPTSIPEGPESKSNALSPLVIGLISAGCAALLIAILALGLLYRARRRYTGNNASYFKSLNDHSSSPTEPSKSSIFQNDDANGSFVGPTFGAIAAGRSSSNTARSGDPMIKNGSLFSGYNNQSTVSTSPLPLLERKGSAVQKEEVPEAPMPIPTVIVGGYDSSSTTTRGSLETKSAPKLEPVLSAGDAALIAETFRKSMRRPRWDDGDDEEQDEARKAANELLRKELSEEGVDVRRGVQRRVTIQDRADRAHRSSVAPPLAEADEH
ncbi:hypothetical protein BG000_010508 [Podila horticola]|nr:hypothetical protein BG000_010508 [Podila horticola]